MKALSLFCTSTSESLEFVLLLRYVLKFNRYFSFNCLIAGLQNVLSLYDTNCAGPCAAAGHILTVT